MHNPESVLPIPYKVVLWILVVGFLVTLIVRVALAVVWAEPTPNQLSLIADLSRYSELILAALLGFLGGKGTK